MNTFLPVITGVAKAFVQYVGDGAENSHAAILSWNKSVNQSINQSIYLYAWTQTVFAWLNGNFFIILL